MARARWMRGLAAASLVLAGAVFPVREGQGAGEQVRITFFALDRGEATLIETPGGMVSLLGAGAPGEGETIVKLLRKRGIRALSAVMAGTWQDRHVGGMKVVLEQVPMNVFMQNPLYVSTPVGDKMLKVAGAMAKAGQLHLAIPTPGEVTTVSYNPPCEIAAVGPTGPMLAQYKGDRDCSLTMEVNYHKVSFLSLGQTNKQHQSALWQQAKRRPWGHVLQIGRNGAADSLAESLLKPLKTRVAVLPIPRKSGARPAASTLAALRRAGVKVYRTDQQGEVTVVTDGTHVKVTTAR